MKWILSIGMTVAATCLASLAPTVGLAAAGPVSASSAQVVHNPPGVPCGDVSDVALRKSLGCTSDDVAIQRAGRLGAV